MEVKTAQEQIQELKEVSEAVDDYMSRALYIRDFGAETDYTENDILRECYALVIEDLQDYGISFRVPVEDLLEDWYTARHITLILKLIKASSLVPMLAKRSDLDALTTTIDNDDEVDAQDDLFILLLRYLFDEDDAKNPEIQAYFYIGVKVISDDRFREYLRECILKIKDTGEDAVVPDIDRASEYIQKVERKRVIIKKVFEIIKATDGKIGVIVNSPLSRTLLERYNLDKVSADNLKRFSVLDWDKINPALEKQRYYIRREHELTQSHHVAYWLDENKLPKPVLKDEHAIFLVMHAYYDGITRGELGSRVLGLKRKLAHKLTDEQKQLMDSVTTIIQEKFIEE